jgi:hypothetical protein
MSSNYTKQQEQGLATCWLLYISLAQRKDRRQTNHERQKDLTESTCRCCDGMLCQRGCAARIRYPRPSRPSPHDLRLSFLRYGEGQRAAQLLAGSFDTGEGQRAPTSRGSRCRFIKMANRSCEVAWKAHVADLGHLRTTRAGR